MKKKIVVKLVIPGFHQWPEAKGAVSYLKYTHRHLFNFYCIAEVTHNNRELEFMTLQNSISEYLSRTYKLASGVELYFGAMSCEAIAEDLLNQFIELSEVGVYEDDENGAIVTR